MRFGIAADHGGFELKAHLTGVIAAAGQGVEDDDMNVVRRQPHR